MNQDLQALHTLLIGYVLTLAEAQENATTLEAIRAIGREIDEMSHRSTIVGQLLFKQQTAKLKAAVDAVKNGTKELDKAIAEIEQLNAFLKTIAGFLKLVDQAIAIAKLIL